MDAIGLAVLSIHKLEAFEDAQDDKRRDALPVRRALVEIVAAIAGVNRLDVLGTLTGEILRLVQAVQLLQPFNDLLHHRALVEGAAALTGDAAERRRDLRLAVAVAPLGRLAPIGSAAGRGKG